MTGKMAGAWAREFRDPADTTWRVRLVRPSTAGERSLGSGRLEALALRFENGIETRQLEPVPPDWRECDEAALWHYCQVASSRGIRRALTGNDQNVSQQRHHLERPAPPVLVLLPDGRSVASPNPGEG